MLRRTYLEATGKSHSWGAGYGTVGFRVESARRCYWRIGDASSSRSTNGLAAGTTAWLP